MKDVMKALEEGTRAVFESEKYKEYLCMMSKLHNYSWNNVLLITMQFPEATMVAGYKAWQLNFGRWVKQGEKGIRILAPFTRKDENDEEHQYFRTVTVFDVSQTEGKELPELCKELTIDVPNYERCRETLERIAPLPVYYEDTGNAKGYCNRSRIVVKPGMSEAQTIKTLVHEIAHAILHKDSCKDKATKEVEAESVAFIVCQYLGVDSGDYSFEYLASWSSGKELKELKSSLKVIRDTSTKIIEEYSAV